MLDQLNKALDALDPDDKDHAAVELARSYARAIDDGEPLDKLGPLLANTLDTLGLTPKSRAAIVKGGTPNGPSSPLDELRQRRRARNSGTENLDPAAP